MLEPTFPSNPAASSAARSTRSSAGTAPPGVTGTATAVAESGRDAAASTVMAALAARDGTSTEVGSVEVMDRIAFHLDEGAARL
jgi:hypothetical protein